MEKNRMLTAALNYRERLNFSVIPVRKDKRPLLKWEEYQKRKASQEEIRSWFNKNPDANIGIVTGAISGLAVIDIDDPEVGKAALSGLVPDSITFPIVKTPSGGEHWYFKCSDSNLSNNARIVPGCDLRANGGYVVAPPSVNGTGKEYSWIPELSPLKVPFAQLPEKYLAHLQTLLHSHACINTNKNTLIGNVTENVTLFQEGRRDNDIFHLANVLAKGGMPDVEIMQHLIFIAQKCNPPFPKEELQSKIASAIKRKEHRDFNITAEVERWVSVTDGDFSVTECAQYIQSVTGATKRDILRKVLQRLKDKGIIRKAGQKDGVYRRVDVQCNEIDFLSASTDSVKIKWPFQVELYVKTHPKNIIVIAGSSNSGKTAYLLNIAAMNMDNFRINYFSSEMGPVELKERLSKFSSVALSDFKKVKWIERAGNFADVIKPDEINIIDFLEMTGDFYLVAQHIKEIFDKLTTGIAIIALQKNREQALGLGGARSLEKARLYLSMDAGKLRIEKGKNWVNQAVNPNGLEIAFKLVQGCHFINAGDWHKKKDEEVIR